MSVQRPRKQRTHTKFLTIVKRFFWYFKRLLIYKTAYFLDTNMIISGIKESDLRHIKLFTVNNRFFFADITYKEVEDKMSDARYRRAFHKKLSMVSFEDLRKDQPGICPIYYNYVSHMYSPANILSESFDIEKIMAMQVKGRKLTKEHVDLKKDLMARIGIGAKSNTASNGRKKSAVAELIDEAYFKGLQKKNHASKSLPKNQFNDYKSLATALLHALVKKENVFYVTSDIDQVNNFLTLLDSLTHEFVMKSLILESTSKEDRENILGGKKKTLYLDLNEYRKKVNNSLLDLFNDDWKGQGNIFGIKFWDQAQQKYRVTISFVINELVRNSLLHLDGNLWCPFASNWDYARWLRFTYWWPPSSPHHGNYFKVVVSKKAGIQRQAFPADEELHERVCQYRADDHANLLKTYTHFWTQK